MDITPEEFDQEWENGAGERVGPYVGADDLPAEGWPEDSKPEAIKRVLEALPPDEGPLPRPSIDPMGFSRQSLEKVNADRAEVEQARKRRFRAARAARALLRDPGERLIGRQ